ncbi:MAG: hypothetical protein C0469_10415 [Cyanobacteria bacterium DS2.3.42]|nr:hypothetical protein [Cyanobacteria bacterium DS2.3.42]
MNTSAEQSGWCFYLGVFLHNGGEVLATRQGHGTVVVEQMEVNEELLSSQLKVADADAQSWGRQADEAEREGKPFL